MRIIAGQYKNLQLVTPGGNRTHPMGERIRSAIFNSLGAKLPDATVLDAFAGTGALGIESISRGAKRAVLVENDKRANRAIRENISKLNTSDQSKIELFPASVNKFLEENLTVRFDIIFADPPYDKLPESILNQLPELLASDGVLILSIPKKIEAISLTGVLLVKSATYADARICYYAKP